MLYQHACQAYLYQSFSHDADMCRQSYVVSQLYSLESSTEEVGSLPAREV